MTQPHPDITPQYLAELLAYDPATGVLTWKKRLSQRAKIGDVAGSKTAGGYWSVCIHGKQLLAHRIAWSIHTGKWPKNLIDHKNGDTLDNRIKNLREATPSVNNANRQKVRSDARAAVIYPGVRWIGEEIPTLFGTSRNLWPWLVKHHAEGKTFQRTAPDLLSAIALKKRLQRGEPAPQRGRKGDPARNGSAA